MELAVLLLAIDFITLEVLSRLVNPGELSRFQIKVANVVCVQSIVSQLVVLAQVSLQDESGVVIIVLEAHVLVQVFGGVQEVALQLGALNLLGLGMMRQ